MLLEFITDAERFAALEGNIGRKITRFITQVFRNNRFQHDFDCKAAQDQADRALFIMRMQNCKESMSPKLLAQFSMAVQCTDVEGVARVVVIPLNIPETMRERQELLASFACIMRRFIACATFADRQCLDKMRREYLEDHAFDVNDVQYTYLAELAKGDFTHLNHTGMNFMSLAIALNPTVEDKFREELARDPV